MIGKWAAIAGALLLASACSAQCGSTTKSAIKTTPMAATPSASPTPTAPLQASGAPFHGGEVGLSYAAVPLAASGGVSPYTWSVSNGSLPGGLTVGADGTVAGTPTSAGSFDFTIQVADAGGGTASMPGAISVVPALSVGLVAACAQYCNVELGCVGVCGAFGQVAGGLPPYSYAVTQGPLPAGTALSGLSLAGTFKGRSGWLQFSVQVADSYGATASLSPKFWMYDHVSLTGGTCGPSRIQCTVSLPYSGGTPGTTVAAVPIAWTGGSCGVVAAFPCPEPVFSATYQPGAVVLKLTYQTNFPATFGTLVVQLTAADPCGPAGGCTSSASVSVVG